MCHSFTFFEILKKVNALGKISVHTDDKPGYFLSGPCMRQEGHGASCTVQRKKPFVSHAFIKVVGLKLRSKISCRYGGTPEEAVLFMKLLFELLSFDIFLFNFANCLI